MLTIRGACRAIMSKGSRRFPLRYGWAGPALLRGSAVYSAQLLWLLVGLWLYHGAFWPSTCTPDSLLEIYACSARLPESGRWREAALLTWLWATPILITLEIARRFTDRT